MNRWAAPMGLALEQARSAAATADVPIGAVLLDAAGQVLAAAGNEREATGDPTAHAEVLVLRRGAERLARTPAADGWRLGGCTLVVTLEPCTMCAGALVAARISRLVFGAFDPAAGAVSSLFDVVRDPRLNHRPEVVSGIRAEESAELLRSFFSTHRVRP